MIEVELMTLKAKYELLNALLTALQVRVEQLAIRIESVVNKDDGK